MATDPWGVEDGYESAFGGWQPTPPETLKAIQAAMGADDDQPSPPPGRPLHVIRHGHAEPLAEPADLVLEDGTTLPVEDRLPPDLPLGYHDLHSHGGATTRLIVSPGRCHLPANLRSWVLAIQLYACRSTRSWGIGDLGSLGQLAKWAADQGVGLLGLNPLHAPLPTRQVEPCPYYPSSKRWLNPLYLDIDQVPGAGDDPEVGRLAIGARALLNDRVIDHDQVWSRKRAALARLWDRYEPDTRLLRWRDEQGTPLERYARFCALAEHHDTGWPHWPAEYRHPDQPQVEHFAKAHADQVAFWAWVQMLLHHQLAETSRDVPFLGDLAIGIDPDGADAWIDQDLLALDVEVGAPPDRFNTQGQAWGLPPYVPTKLRDAGYRPLIEQWRAALAHSGGLRIDHILGFFRLFWIPAGCDPASGGYVRYRDDELLAILAIESTRAGALVVGEDLGTVEAGVRQTLAEANVLSTRLAWFEATSLDQLPSEALAAVTTHDLPTAAGVWSGADAAELRALDRPTDAEQSETLRQRLIELSGCETDSPVDDVILAFHKQLAQSPAMLVAATLEDACAVPERPNIPGSTTAERPNWSLALPQPLEEALDSPLASGLASQMRATGRSGAGSPRP